MIDLIELRLEPDEAALLGAMVRWMGENWSRIGGQGAKLRLSRDFDISDPVLHARLSKKIVALDHAAFKAGKT